MRPPCPNRHHSRARGLLRHRSSPSDRSGVNRYLTAAIPQLPASDRTLRQPRRHYAARASSDDAQLAPADKDLRWLAQVRTPSDGLTARQNRRPCNAICTRPLPAGYVSPSATWRTPSLGKWLNPMNRLAAAKRHRCQCRVPRRREGRPRHKTGVVSLVPRSSRNA